MNITYSIIIPHHNMPHSLQRLVNSIPDRDDVQILVGDDCSSPEHNEELERFRTANPRVEWFSTGTNGGAGKARNVCLKHAKGKFLLFADSDDFFTPALADVLDKYAKSEQDIVYFSANSVDTVTYRPADRWRSINPLIDRYLTTGNPDDIKHKFTAPWCKLISRELVLLHDIRFQETVVFNDMRFSQLVDYYSKNIAVDKTAIYCVTERENSVSAVTKPEKEIAKMEVVAGYYQFAQENGLKCYPLWSFIGPTFDAIKQNHWDEYMSNIFDVWVKIGIPKRKISSAYRKYKFKTRLIIPIKDFLH